MGDWVEVGAKAGTSPPSCSCSRRAAAGGGGANLRSRLHHIAPRDPPALPGAAAAAGGGAPVPMKKGSHGGFGSDLVKIPTATTETPFTLKLYIFLFKFCNIASSLVLLSFPLLVFNLFLIYIYILLTSFLFSYFTK